jgi:hypothetical protein
MIAHHGLASPIFVGAVGMQFVTTASDLQIDTRNG